MARAIRKSVPLKFGVLSAPVDVVKATDSPRSNKTVCISGHEPQAIKQTLACPRCENDDRSTFEKAAETADGLVVLTKETIASAGPPDEVRETLALTAHAASEVLRHTMPHGNVYYLKPSKGSEDVYALLRDLLIERDDVAFVVEFAVKSSAELFLVSVHERALTLSQLARPDLIREAPDSDQEAGAETIAMMSSLVDKLVQEFDPHSYRDRRREYLEEAVLAAANGDQPVLEPVARPDAQSLNDMLAAALAEVA